jgi:hypothetical protein
MVGGRVATDSGAENNFGLRQTAAERRLNDWANHHNIGRGYG